MKKNAELDVQQALSSEQNTKVISASNLNTYESKAFGDDDDDDYDDDDDEDYDDDDYEDEEYPEFPIVEDAD